MYPQIPADFPGVFFLGNTPEEEAARYAALFCVEKRLNRQGFHRIAGVDEAGRGPLAGPVVAGAVILPEAVYLPGLADSKVLSPKKRACLAEQIFATALTWSVGVASVAEIDALNIRCASFLAMHRALEALRFQPEYVVVDGSAIPDLPLPQTGIVRGDARVAAVAAASIIAKVTRDRLMEDIHREFPQYGFSRHKGYPTREHFESLARFGPTPHHRRSFGPVKSLLKEPFIK
ncbi:MAG TPA: ribonuclease HII [Desulfotomaculum sp.]|nr:ribonuclease HII [Desulfotomaculum sp.]